ncbi:MAG: type IX secretion system membrane protein PorP/SprF [Lewinellaceae bacterium]|nr:type IX secretion system membrane protein PorP/SprF [Saprospiraceae bacterium]MCB9341118.1 type IX secretion system membrane protein PorP/SprF [Lewinellaceae bacterium]
MKYYLPLLLAFFFTGMAYSQQGVHYTQFMFNKLAFNPAYAGSHEVPCISAIHRSQWVGFDGAPVSQAFNFHTPLFAKRVGMGVSIQHDKIGPTNSFWLNLSYAYRIKIEKSTLSIGLQGSMRSYNVDFSKTESIIQNDVAVLEGNARRILPNFGAGVYYLSDLFYAGISAPYIFNNDISLYETAIVDNTDIALEKAHFYAMAGLRVDMGQKVKFKPAMLYKQVKNAPVDLEINGTFVFADRLGVGATYRMGGIRNSVGESVDFLLYMQFEGGFKIGAAYDLSLSAVRQYQSGSFEIMVEKCLKTKDDRLTNPRFFF